MRAHAALVAIRLGHTAVWALFVACIAAVPVAAWLGRFGWSLTCAGIVFGEVLVLALNRWRCPLTDVAERYTDERRANFDIYLPLWLAKFNKEIFGTLFVAGCTLAVVLWWRRLGS